MEHKNHIKEAISATLTVEEAHEILGKGAISRGGFYAAINRKEVPHLRLGQRILIPRYAFFKWLESAGAVTGNDSFHD